LKQDDRLTSLLQKWKTWYKMGGLAFLIEGITYLMTIED